MIDFEVAKKEAFNQVINTRSIEKVCDEVKQKDGRTVISEYWRIKVEVPFNGQIRDFTLELSLPPYFPLSLPIIKLAESDYQATKYLPHIDSGRVICLFDKENIKQNIGDPAGIVNACINQAVRILENGLNNDRVVEFNDEIIAYWQDTYHKDDVVVGGYLGSKMSELQPGQIPAYYLEQAHGKVNLYVGNDENETEKLIGLFKLRGHTLQNLNAFYVGEINDFAPPFYYDYRLLLTFLQVHFIGVWKEVRAYLNRESLKRKFIIFSVLSDNKPIFFGLFLPAFKANFNGWKTGQTAIKIMSSVTPIEPVTRVCFTEFNLKRLQARTDGRTASTLALKVMVAGLGSIGSNLVFYLSALEISNYVLVDPETLAIENINRHLLSFNEVGMKKVDGIANFLKLNRPFSDIQKHDCSVVDIIQRHLSSINDLDLIFCAIGKDAIEEYILEQLATGTITKPVFLFWVEPYLLGAHVLYVRPGTGFALSDLEINRFYKFNIISEDTYKDPAKNLLMREAGCQASYMPYSQSEIMLFFAALTPHLYTLINTLPESNFAITYMGNIDTAVTLDLSLSPLASTLKSHQIIIQAI